MPLPLPVSHLHTQVHAQALAHSCISFWIKLFPNGKWHVFCTPCTVQCTTSTMQACRTDYCIHNTHAFACNMHFIYIHYTSFWFFSSHFDCALLQQIFCKKKKNKLHRLLQQIQKHIWIWLLYFHSNHIFASQLKHLCSSSSSTRQTSQITKSKWLSFELRESGNFSLCQKIFSPVVLFLLPRRSVIEIAFLLIASKLPKSLFIFDGFELKFNSSQVSGEHRFVICTSET